MDVFQEIFDTLTGDTEWEFGMDWVPNLFAEKSTYAAAYRELWNAREIGKCMFFCGIEYAQRNRKS